LALFPHVGSFFTCKDRRQKTQSKTNVLLRRIVAVLKVNRMVIESFTIKDRDKTWSLLETETCKNGSQNETWDSTTDM